MKLSCAMRFVDTPRSRPNHDPDMSLIHKGLLLAALLLAGVASQAQAPTGTPPPPPSEVAQLTATANVNIRKGPGTNYDILGVLLLGQQAEITGRNADGTWWQIKFPAGSGGVGWVSAAYVSAENIGNVPIVAAPPPPPTPPPTPTPSPGQQFPEWRGE